MPHGCDFVYISVSLPSNDAEICKISWKHRNSTKQAAFAARLKKSAVCSKLWCLSGAALELIILRLRSSDLWCCIMILLVTVNKAMETKTFYKKKYFFSVLHFILYAATFYLQTTCVLFQCFETFFRKEGIRLVIGTSTRTPNVYFPYCRATYGLGKQKTSM